VAKGREWQNPPRNKARTAAALAKGNLRMNPAVVKEENKNSRAGVKSSTNPNASALKSTSMLNSVKKSKSVSPSKPSVAKAALKGAANKVKAQGAKMNMTPSTTAAARARAAKKN
jgi:hypothetical protein